jgi:hypothetical protein
MMPGPRNPRPALAGLAAIGVVITGVFSAALWALGWLLRAGGVL